MFGGDPSLVYECGEFMSLLEVSRRLEVPLGQFPSFGISGVFGGVASHFMTYEAFSVPWVLCLFCRGELYPRGEGIYIHCIGVWVSPSESHQLGLLNVAVSSSSELSESYNIVVEFSCFIEPLLPFLSSLFLVHGKGSCSHHSGQLVGNPSLKGVH